MGLDRGKPPGTRRGLLGNPRRRTRVTERWRRGRIRGRAKGSSSTRRRVGLCLEAGALGRAARLGSGSASIKRHIYKIVAILWNPLALFTVSDELAFVIASCSSGRNPLETPFSFFRER